MSAAGAARGGPGWGDGEPCRYFHSTAIHSRKGRYWLMIAGGPLMTMEDARGAVAATNRHIFRTLPNKISENGVAHRESWR